MTSVAGTADRDRGTMDKLDRVLEDRSKELGIRTRTPIWWRWWAATGTQPCRNYLTLAVSGSGSSAGCPWRPAADVADLPGEPAPLQADDTGTITTGWVAAHWRAGTHSWRRRAGPGVLSPQVQAAELPERARPDQVCTAGRGRTCPLRRLRVVPARRRSGHSPPPGRPGDRLTRPRAGRGRASRPQRRGTRRHHADPARPARVRAGNAGVLTAPTAVMPGGCGTWHRSSPPSTVGRGSTAAVGN